MQSSITNTKLLNTEYVYCMSNASFCPNIVKVGWTRNNPALRANQLFTTGVPTPFVVEFMVMTAHGYDLERRIHNHLARCRVSGSREFFNISVSDLRNVLREKFSLTMVQLSDVVDQMPKVHSNRKSAVRKDKWKSFKNTQLSEASPEPTQNSELMFDRFRYNGPLFVSKSCETGSMFDNFRYDGPLFVCKSSESLSTFDRFRYDDSL